MTNVAAANNQHSSIDYWKKKLGLPIAIVLFLAVWLMPTPVGLSIVGHKALALFAGILVLFLTEAVPLPITSLAVVPLAVLFGICNIGVALNGYGSSSTYLLVGALILAIGMTKSRLAERLTYLIMKGVGTSAKRISIGIVLANIVLAFLVPSSTARTAILLPVCLSIIEVFKLKEKSKYATGLLLTLAFTNATIGAGILTATVPNPVTIEFIQKAGGPLISYMDWLKLGFPPALLMTIITWWIIRLMLRPEVDALPAGQGYVDEKLKDLGPVSINEKRAAFIFGLVVLLWTTAGWTKIDTTVSCLVGVCLLFFPGTGFLTWDDAQKNTSWSILILTGGGISLGNILMVTGAAKWLAASIFSGLGLQGLGVVVMLIIIMVVLQLMHAVFVGTTVMATALIPFVLGMAETAHINPVIFALPAGMIIGGYPVLMFYSTLPNLIIYGTGKVTVGDFPRVGAVISIVACIVYAACAAVYWPWMGLY